MSIIIVFGVSFGIKKITFKNKNSNIYNSINFVSKKNNNNNIVNIKNLNNNVDNENKLETNIIKEEKSELEEYDWYIKIPKIKLYAPIEEGTSIDILNRSIGHFENSSRRNGNCGFAAHNRGYNVNYFAKLKQLEKGDIIFYFVDGKKYKYKVEVVTIIYETDWSMLNETSDDRITLITCVENREEYRLCVQGILVEE